jgi:AraC-like DNA-binding protein
MSVNYLSSGAPKGSSALWETSSTAPLSIAVSNSAHFWLEYAASSMSLLTDLQSGTPRRARGRQICLAVWQRRKLEGFLAAHLSERLTIPTLARHIGISPSHFHRAFKASFGATPRVHVEHLRLKRAQELMLTTNMPLAEISVAVGLSDQAQLCKLFRRAFCQSPARWRLSNLVG